LRVPAATSPGYSFQQSDLTGKRLELMQQAFPDIKVLTVSLGSDICSRLRLGKKDAAQQMLAEIYGWFTVLRFNMAK
jgi:hypothetical protein